MCLSSWIAKAARAPVARSCSGCAQRCIARIVVDLVAHAFALRSLSPDSSGSSALDPCNRIAFGVRVHACTVDRCAIAGWSRTREWTDGPEPRVDRAAVYWLDFLPALGDASLFARCIIRAMRWRARVLPNLPICWIVLAHPTPLPLSRRRRFNNQA